MQISELREYIRIVGKFLTFQRFLFMPIGDAKPLHQFRPVAITNFIINNAVMR